MSEYMLVVKSKTNRIVRLFKDVPGEDRAKLRLALNKKYPPKEGYEGDFFATDNPWSYLAIYENANKFQEEVKRTSPSEYKKILEDLFLPS